MGSALEGDFPRALLLPNSDPDSSTSTIQALKSANDQGIPIYTIDRSNATTVMPLLEIDSGDLTGIQDSVNAGLTVIVSKKPILAGSRAVLGMIVADPQTGAASFLISEGTNGAIIFMTLTTLCAIAFEASLSILLPLEFVIFSLIAIILVLVLDLTQSPNRPLLDLSPSVARYLLALTTIATALVAILVTTAAIPLTLLAFLGTLSAVEVTALIADVLQKG